MSERRNPAAHSPISTRREMIAGVAVAFGALATASHLRAQPRQQPMKQVPSKPENKTRTSLHDETDFKASPQRIYEVLLDSKQFAACTGMPATIDPNPGGAFTMFGGLIEGRNVELVPSVRIVQAWRPAHWDPGIYSIAHFEFKPKDSGTLLAFDHTGFPEGDYDSLEWGWTNHYWNPLTKYLA